MRGLFSELRHNTLDLGTQAVLVLCLPIQTVLLKLYVFSIPPFTRYVNGYIVRTPGWWLHHRSARGHWSGALPPQHHHIELPSTRSNLDKSISLTSVGWMVTMLEHLHPYTHQPLIYQRLLRPTSSSISFLYIIIFFIAALATINPAVHAASNVTIDDGDGRIAYSPAGVWAKSAQTSLNYGGSHMLTQNPAAKATFNFTGASQRCSSSDLMTHFDFDGLDLLEMQFANCAQ